MANTFRKIQTVTVGSGGSASIDFTSIPQTYTDLKIILSARDNRTSAVNDFARLAFNSDTTNGNYTGILLYSDGSTANGYTFTSAAAYRYGGEINGPSSTANCFSSSEIYIPNYRGSNNKSYSSESVVEMNSTTGLGTLVAGLWSNTAAITSISLTPANGTLFLEYSSATLYGVANVPITEGAKATGGIITADNNYIYHTFLSSATFTPTQSLNVDYLVVAGGGGGAAAIPSNNAGGGGGAGGLRCTVGTTGGGGSLESQLSLTATAYTVTVGAGGAGGAAGGNNKGVQGSNSVFSTITSTGGGFGGAEGDSGGAGGSGGGSGRKTASQTGGAGTANQGYNGGDSVNSGNYPGGGGGGAGALGANATTSNGGAGGNGIATSISGTSTNYGGGGGGGVYITGTPGTGGTGGGGAAGAAGLNAGNPGTANTGGGGGGASINGTAGGRAGGTGGSGIVIVRYAR